MKNSLFSTETLQKVQKVRKIFLKVAVWVLIGELALGAILILFGVWNVEIGKVQGTFLIIATILFMSVNNFIRIEKGNKPVQIFALIGFISNLIWGLFALLLMWEVAPVVWTEQLMERSTYLSYTHTVYHLTFYSIAMLIAAYTAAGGFWISNVLSIKETTKTVKPLKITAVVCWTYIWIFLTIMTPLDFRVEGIERWLALSGLAVLAFWATAIAAWIISRTSGDKPTEEAASKKAAASAPQASAPIAAGDLTPAPQASKTDAELRAEIEEKVRREMIEKEVRARIEAEQKGAAKAKDGE